MQASVCAAQGEFPPARRKVQLTTAVARALRRDRRVCYAQETLPGCSAVGETPQSCCAGRPSHRSTAWSTQRLISGQQQQRQSCWTTDEVRVASPLRCSTAGSGRSTAAGADGICCCSTCTTPAQGAASAQQPRRAGRTPPAASLRRLAPPLLPPYSVCLPHGLQRLAWA